MLIGPSIIGVVRSGSKTVVPACDWFTGRPYEVSNLIIPMRREFSVARITCIAPGQSGGLISNPLTNITDPSSPYYYAQDNYYDNYQQSGGGGNCVTSVVNLSLDDNFAISINYQSLTTYVTNNGNTMVLANNADLPQTSYVGQSIRYGTKGTTSYAGRTNSQQPPRNMSTIQGGGAGGTFGNATGELAGSCTIWQRSSDGLTATAGGSNQNYGGGAPSDSSGSNTSGAQGLIVIEWGVGVLF